MRRCSSGNAVMLVALGLPVLVGGTGLAVDTAQWYMWKGELQYAADQAAIAGAWARTKDVTEDSYDDRALQEFTDNLQITAKLSTEVENGAPVPAVSLENYATGTLNSVVVTASASKPLPFSNFLTGRAATVRVRAQAAFEVAINAEACLVAVDDEADGAVTIAGSATFIAGCGIKALSNAGSPDNPDGEAISVLGNPTITAGTLFATGAISEWFDDDENPRNVGNNPRPFEDNLVDDFADLDTPSTPQSQVARDYECPKGKTTSTYVADSVVTTSSIVYTYWKRSTGSGPPTYTQYDYSGGTYFKPNVNTTQSEASVTLAELPAGIVAPPAGTGDGTVNSSNETGYVQIDGNGSNRIYEKSASTISKVYDNVHFLEETEQGDAAVLLPGTYGDLDIKCDTVFTPGIYVLDGGELGINAQHDVTGAGVMFVLKNNATIQINGGADVNLTAMTVSELQSAGIAYDEAVRLDGMLIFEDREFDPDQDEDGDGKQDEGFRPQHKMNGNASTILNGTVYLPKGNLDIMGSAGVTSQCLLLVASTITISGNVQMESFCPPGQEADDDQSALLGAKVRLVS